MTCPDWQHLDAKCFCCKSRRCHAILISGDCCEPCLASDEDLLGWGHFDFGTRWVARQRPGTGGCGRRDVQIIHFWQSARLRNGLVSPVPTPPPLPPPHPPPFPPPRPPLHPQDLSLAGDYLQLLQNLHLAYLLVHPAGKLPLIA